MQRLFKLRKGLDIRLKGEAVRSLTTLTATGGRIAVRPTDFLGIRPRLRVAEGDRVKAGTPLFVDKATEKIHVVSPVSGTVSKIVRGDRRKLLAIEIQSDFSTEYATFPCPADVKKATADEMRQLLLESGLFAFFRSRPYDVIPSPDATPKAIFVSTFSKMPLAADFSFVAQGQEEDFRLGIAALSRLVKRVHVGICPEQINSSLLPLEGVEVSVFDGPNPAGNVSVHINHVAPIAKGEEVWTLGAEAVLFVGRLMRTDRVDLRRRIAVAGELVREPRYVETLIGTPLGDILQDESLGAAEAHARVTCGNPLYGERAAYGGCLSAFATEVCVLPEGDDVEEPFGWIMPRLSTFSTHRSYFSWLFSPRKRYHMDCRVKGGERHMIMSAEYERVLPMDIYPSYLIKAILAGDIDRQEALGIYEVAPEDFALAEFICSSKLELTRIVREGLDTLMKENA